MPTRSRHQDHRQVPGEARHPAVIGAAIAIGVFILDTITPREIALAALYVGVVLLSARFLQKRGVVLASLGLMALTGLSYLLSEHDKSPDTPFRTAFSA